MSESYESNTDNLASFLVGRAIRAHQNKTTVRKATKATRTHGSTVVVRTDTAIMHAPCLSSVWDSYYWTNRFGVGASTHRDVAGRLPSSTVRPGGKVQLQDMHK